ncbi:hypothetical protein CfE428DRAFT_3035 [Chthoniobacter flavus Ellin428]|uniref:GYF domain-containing protein n=1 Tax=Chthoniobacter flavus Ellin428 TaxID=497964 RepID=B4D2B0_9BACT|nr:DUF4339 domain-containing protein [Chthoniobacter flavus]EDY19350.1 hypothetical protein CfE428DRAFT_3035 [Chthoniobacter flavus Ellin428]
MNAIWHYEENGESKGPLSREEIRDLVQTGVVTPQTRVWTRSLKRWAPARETTLDNLFKTSAPAAQTPPLPPAMGQLVPPPVPIADTPEVSTAETRSAPPEGFRSPQLLGHCVTALIVILTLLAAVKIWFEAQQIELLDRLQHAPEIKDQVLLSESWHLFLSVSWPGHLRRDDRFLLLLDLPARPTMCVPWGLADSRSRRVWP